MLLWCHLNGLEDSLAFKVGLWEHIPLDEDFEDPFFDIAFDR